MEVFKYTDKYLYDGETVMFGRKGTLGKPLYAKGKFWTVDTMYYLKFTKKLFPKYNYYQLTAFDWTPFITQTALPSIVASEVIAEKFVFTDYLEQQEIASYLDKKCTAIESAISKKTSLIDKLKEYKKSLIYECVTGKRECCNF